MHKETNRKSTRVKTLLSISRQELIRNNQFNALMMRMETNTVNSDVSIQTKIWSHHIKFHLKLTVTFPSLSPSQPVLRSPSQPVLSSNKISSCLTRVKLNLLASNGIWSDWTFCGARRSSARWQFNYTQQSSSSSSSTSSLTSTAWPSTCGNGPPFRRSATPKVLSAIPKWSHWRTQIDWPYTQG